MLGSVRGAGGGPGSPRRTLGALLMGDAAPRPPCTRSSMTSAAGMFPRPGSRRKPSGGLVYPPPSLPGRKSPEGLSRGAPRPVRTASGRGSPVEHGGQGAQRLDWAELGAPGPPAARRLECGWSCPCVRPARLPPPPLTRASDMKSQPQPWVVCVMVGGGVGSKGPREGPLT